MESLYTRKFNSTEGTPYEVRVLSSDTSMAPSTVDMPWNAPVEIEWAETDKLDPVQGSALSLTLISDTDRRFVDLFTVEPGKIRVELLRNGVLYWTGCLDPELYGEPYSQDRDYEVVFAFSDFALLDRLSWQKHGVVTMRFIIEECLSSAGLGSLPLCVACSTMHGGTPLDIDSIYLLCDNFFDEDGEPMTMRKVLEEILRPFGLRLIQKGGRIHMYDLNAVHVLCDSEEVYWMGADAELGVDKLYNNVKITFSPYADTTLIDGSLDHSDVLKGKSGKLWMTDTEWGNCADGFRLVTGAQEDLPLKLYNGAVFFRIDSEHSGSDEAGVAMGYKGNTAGDYDKIFLKGFGKPSVVPVPIISTEQSFIGYVGSKGADYRLKVSLSLLFDVRYNPFETSGEKNEEGNYDRLQDWCNFGYVPVMLYLKDTDGNIIYHYENHKIINIDGFVHNSSNCGWRSGAGNWGCMWLCWYDWENRKSTSGFGGWQKNKPIIGYWRKGLPKKLQAMGDGEFIELPPCGGFLEMHIGAGIRQFDYKREEKDIYAKARWLLYKEPKVELVNRNGTTIRTEDVEDSAWVNRSAKEDLSIDTITGTPADVCLPSARGLLMDGNHSALKEFTRAGVTDRLERLLIGTAYSQYAERRTVLSGTARILPEFSPLTDASTPGKFILLAETQNIMMDTSEIKMSEFTSDEYQGIEFE